MGKKFENKIIDDDQQYKDIAYDQLLMKAVNRIHHSMTIGYNTSAPIRGLKQMLRPYFDDKFKVALKKLENEFEKDKKSSFSRRMATGKDKQRIPEYAFYEELFGLLIGLMDRNNLLLPTEGSAEM